MLTAVLLDAGGVIVDETDIEIVFKGIIVDLLAPIVPGYCYETCCADMEESVRCFCPSVYRYLLWKYATSVSQYEELLAAFLRLRRERWPGLRLARGIEGQLERIAASYRIGIAGQYGRELLDLFDQTNLRHYFTYHFTQDDFAITKPDPRYFQQILERCGLKASETVMVGDRIDNDVIPARQVGMKSIRVRGGLHNNQEPRLPSEIPDLEIQTTDDLASALLDLQQRCF